MRAYAPGEFASGHPEYKAQASELDEMSKRLPLKVRVTVLLRDPHGNAAGRQRHNLKLVNEGGGSRETFSFWPMPST